MTNKDAIGEVLESICLDEYEKSLAFIGCARWGQGFWYEKKPNVSDFQDKPQCFTEAIFQFAKDFNQGRPILVSNLVEILDDDSGESLLLKGVQNNINFLSALFNIKKRGFIEQHNLSEFFGADSINYATLPFKAFNDISEQDILSLTCFYLNISNFYAVDGFVFIVFESYIIQLTWHGWAVYAKEGSDIRFVRWFFTLTNRVCKMNPAFLFDIRDPFIDEYDPLSRSA